MSASRSRAFLRTLRRKTVQEFLIDGCVSVRYILHARALVQRSWNLSQTCECQSQSGLKAVHTSMGLHCCVTSESNKKMECRGSQFWYRLPTLAPNPSTVHTINMRKQTECLGTTRRTRPRTAPNTHQRRDSGGSIGRRSSLPRSDERFSARLAKVPLESTLKQRSSSLSFLIKHAHSAPLVAGTDASAKIPVMVTTFSVVRAQLATEWQCSNLVDDKNDPKLAHRESDTS